MKTFKKLTTMLLTAMLVLSTGVTGVSATEETSTEIDSLITKNKVEDITVAKSEASAVTESAQVDVHKGDVLNFWVEVTIPNDKPDVTGWTIDMYYDDAIFDLNTEFANGYGFASGTKAIEYALGISNTEVSLPGGSLTQSGFRSGEVRFTDANYYGFKFTGTTTLSYKMRDLIDSNLTADYYVDKTNYQPMNGAEFALKYDVICNHNDKVAIFGDINLELTELDENVYSGTVDLNSGTYKFRVNEFGTQMCYGQTFTDIMNGIKYSSSYSSATTFDATGGRYTFTYNTAKDMLIIKHKPFTEIVELFGDINVELVRTSSASTVFTGSARVEAGTYNYKVNDQGVIKGYGYTFNDSVYDKEYNADWSKETTFVATGGIYSVSYDTATSKLTFKHAPKGLGDVRIFGDVNIDLAKEYGTTYSATQTLEAGTYEIRVDSFGQTLCNGSTFTDYIGKVEYKDTWKSATKFNARGGKYTFKFDSSTNKLTVVYAPIEEKVSIFGDINLELNSTDNIKYTGKVNLESGKYSFRIDDFGTTYCYGATIKDSKAKIQYSSKYKAATILDATGGTYSFTYDKSNNQLTVLKTA